MGRSDVSGTIMEALKAKIGKSVICRFLSVSVSGDLDSERKGIGFNLSLNNKQKIEVKKLNGDANY